MFLKNSARRFGNSIRVTPFLFARWSTHSLRLRLMFWYGSLLLLGLTCFALLMLLLVSNVINENTQGAVDSVTHVAMNNLYRSLSPQTPYWPASLKLDALDNYRSPGMTVEVFNQHGTMLYSSDLRSALDLDYTTWQRLTRSFKPTWYNTDVDGDQALVEISAIYPPQQQVHPSQSASRDMIGILLVAKSLHDVNTTLSSLQGLLVLTGAIILVLFLGCGWAVMGYTLRPLSDLVKMAGSIASDTARGKRVSHLNRRVRRPEGGDEMSQVVDAFNEMLNSIESSTAGQRRFIADASHELRAPLTTIQGNLAFLIRYIDEIPPTERRTMLADAHGETLRLASLVDELLLLARADASMGQPVVPTQPAPIVELDRALLKLVRQMRRRLEIEGTTLKIEIGGIEPVRVRGDEENIRRVMVILLDNAIKYTRTEEGKGEGKITVALQRLGKQAVLRVSDTGIGIESKDLPHIFERFYRADLARSREGTGLGLAIAQTLVEQLNGRITAESTPGEGSTFRVTLPLA
ncbi:MAG TPA: HAMP domain-containing sensor histidine kinase [Ktedonobacteraceae bacterium]